MEIYYIYLDILLYCLKYIYSEPGYIWKKEIEILKYRVVDIPFHEEKLIFKGLKWQNYLKDEQMPDAIGLDLKW